MHTHTVSHSLPHTHTHTHTHALTQNKDHTLSTSHSQTCNHTHSLPLSTSHTHTRTHTHSLPDVARGLQPWPDSRQWKRSVLYTLYGFPWFGKAAEHRDQLKVQRHESTANSFHRTHTDMLTKENLYNFQTTLYMFLPVQSMVEG